MELTVEAIQSASSNEELVDLLTAELQLRLPEEMVEDRDLYHRTLDSLPRGLRAMAGIHEFDLSMSMDDLAWHFGNQNDERDLRETSGGLRELGLTEFADFFDRAWKIMEPHLDALRRGEIKAEDFSDWLENIGAQKQIDPMNDAIWDYCERFPDLGLMQSWAEYARKYPERCVVAEAQA
jgi:hypothetical protein